MTRAGLAALVAWSAAALLVAPAAETAPAAKSKSQWRLFPGPKTDLGRPLLAVGWAANRVWFVTPYRDVPILGSARVTGRRLIGFADTRVPTNDTPVFPIVDGALVLPDKLVTAPLLSSGRLGALKPLADDLLTKAKEAVPKVETVSIRAGVRVGDRTVWAFEADPECQSIGGCPYSFLACCSESGAAVDLTRFIDLRTFNLLPPYMGRDTRGRVWLAWLDRKDYRGAVRGVPRILELDPSTLAPRSTAVAAPGVVADRIELACAASCRLVAQTAGLNIVSWAPGERSPTRVASHWERGKLGDFPVLLIAAAYRSGQLFVAYHGVHGKTLYDSSARDLIRVVRGDSRGARARVVGTFPYLYGWPPGKLYPPFLDPVVYGKFVPGGLVALGHFRNSTSYTPSPVVFAVVRLGR